MKFKIGFSAEHETAESSISEAQPVSPPPIRRSLVQVRFYDDQRPLTYYNDQFDLHVDDVVYVDGKMEGVRGRVLDVNYNFKIKLSDYRKVIAMADTTVSGKLWLAGSHLISFDPDVIPYEKVSPWFMPPCREEEEFVSSYSDDHFPLADLGEMKVSAEIAERGREYYWQNHVCYICLEGTQGRAIVYGTHPYALEFRYEDGQISRLTCSCYCNYHCKHQVAAMLQLQESLKLAQDCYAEEYRESGYMAIILKDALFEFGAGYSKRGSITFS